MINYYRLREITDYTILLIKKLINVSGEVIKGIENSKERAALLKEVRPGFDEVLGHINFGRLPKKKEEMFSELNASIVKMLY